MPPPMQSPVQTPLGETWPTRTNSIHDQSTGQTTYISVKANNGPPHPNKLPYLHSILQKEITRPQPFSMKQHTMSSTVMMPPPPPPPAAPFPSSPSPFVTMHHSPSIYESHSTQTTPLVPSPMSPAQMHHQAQQQMMMDHHSHHQHMSNMIMGSAQVESGGEIMGPTPVPMHAIHSAQVEFVTESMDPPAMTTTPPPPSMTTDSYFAHYNQPQQAIGGPMYLIIEGHSKVKNYGQADEEGMHMPKIVPVVPTEESVITHVGSDEPMVKHLHRKGDMKSEEKEEEKEKRSQLKSGLGKESGGGLLSFIDSSLGDFMRAEEEDMDDDNSVLDEEKKQ